MFRSAIHIKRLKLFTAFLFLISSQLLAQVDLPTPVTDSNEIALKYMKEQRPYFAVKSDM